MKEVLLNLTSLELAIFTLTFLIIVIVILIVYIIDYYGTYETKKMSSFDLKNATKILEAEANKPREVIMGEYEKEQEENAIISYDEFLEQTTKLDINSFKNNIYPVEKKYDDEISPISIEEYENVTLPKQEDLELTKEMAFLTDLKTFRSNMK